jgi:uncharacterized small protein (DUF1192 family)
MNKPYTPPLTLPMSCLPVLADAVEFAIQEMEYRVAEWKDDDEETKAERRKKLESYRALVKLFPTP